MCARNIYVENTALDSVEIIISIFYLTNLLHVAHSMHVTLACKHMRITNNAALSVNDNTNFGNLISEQTHTQF